MDIQSPPEPIVIPTNHSLPSHPQETRPDVKPGRHHVWFVGGGVIIIGIIALYTLSKLLNPPPPPISQTEVATPTPSPTPIRRVSQVATENAYVMLERAHASLSAQLAATNLDDPSLSPPVLELPLGFKQ